MKILLLFFVILFINFIFMVIHNFINIFFIYGYNL